MEISNCAEDFQEELVYLVIAINAEVCLCFVLSWNMIAIIACIIINIPLSILYYMDWVYLSRKIVLDELSCTFILNTSTRRIPWNEMNIQHITDTSFLFGDSEIPGEGIILSAKPISKPAHIGAMTYCRFTNPRTSVFIRFEVPFDISKKTAKFVYRGFVANKSDVLLFLDRITNK